MILQKFVLRGGVAMERGLHFVQLHLKRSGWQLIYNDGMDICNISRNNTFFVMSTIFQYVPICSSTAWPVQSNSKKARGSTSSWTCSNSRLQSSLRWIGMAIEVLNGLMKRKENCFEKIILRLESGPHRMVLWSRMNTRSQRDDRPISHSG